MADNLQPVDRNIIKEKYYTISAVVEDAISDIDGTMDKFLKFLKFALRGYRELNFSGLGQIKTVRMSMDDTRTIICPEDYVRYTKVALLIGNKLRTIGVADDAGAMPGYDECNNLLSEEGVNDFPNGINFNNYGGYYFHNYNQGDIFSYGGGLPYMGYFKEYREPRPARLKFVSEVNKSDVFMEYYTDGMNPDGETMVDPLEVDYLRKFIHQERVCNNDRLPQALKDEKKRDVHWAKKKIVIRKDPFSPTDLLNITRKYYRLTPKA